MLPLLLLNLAFLPIAKVAIIDIHGTIGEQVKAADVIEALQEVEENPAYAGVILDINSGGGSAVESHEIVRYLLKMKKPCVARVGDIATSGAYWIASACDAVVADELSVVGAIGALSIYPKVNRALSRLGVDVVEVSYPENKSFGSPFLNLSSWEEEHAKRLVQSAGAYFKQEILELRPNIGNYTTGLPYLAKDAPELVDYFGGLEKAKEVIEKIAGVRIIGYEHIETRPWYEKFLEKFLANVRITLKPESFLQNLELFL